MKKRQLNLKIVAVVIVLMAAAAYFGGTLYYSRSAETKITSINHGIKDGDPITYVNICQWRDSVSRGLHWDCDRFGSSFYGLSALKPTNADLYVQQNCWDSLSQSDRDIIESWSNYRCPVSYSWNPPQGDPCPLPSPAQIDDSTDTLSFDKTPYKLGETVIMSASGNNVGSATWNGKVSFTITQPDGSVYTVEDASGISVAAGSSKTVGGSFTLPSSGQSGTWTAQSMWITDEGVTDARSSILDLGEADAEDNTIWIIGGIAAFLLLLYFAFRKTKR